MRARAGFVNGMADMRSIRVMEGSAICVGRVMFISVCAGRTIGAWIPAFAGMTRWLKDVGDA
jgi:hypothetical protein